MRKPTEEASRSDGGLMRQFLFMSMAFSANVGTVNGTCAVAAALLGKQAGAYSLACLYGTMVVGSLVLSSVLVEKYGTRACLVVGSGGMTFYVLTNCVAVYVPSIKLPLVLIGASIGGTAAGILWTGQGVYYARSCDLLSERTGISIEDASNKLGGRFATAYLIGELFMKGASSPLLWLIGDLGLFITYSTISIIAVGLLSRIADIDALCLEPTIGEDRAGRTTKYGSINDTDGTGGDDAPAARDRRSTSTISIGGGGPYDTVKAVFELLLRDRKLQLMAFTQAAFGIYVSFLNFYLDGQVVPEQLGKEFIGIFASLTVSVGALVSFYSPVISLYLGKSFTLALGAVSFMVLCVPFMVQDGQSLQVWEIALVYFLAGFGRAAYESANKSIFVDFFPEDKEAAFPTIMLISGIATLAGFMSFPSATPVCMSAVLFSASLAGIVGYAAARRIKDAEMKALVKKSDGLLDLDLDQLLSAGKQGSALDQMLLPSRQRTFSTQAGLMSVAATVHNRSRRKGRTPGHRSRQLSVESQLAYRKAKDKARGKEVWFGPAGSDSLRQRSNTAPLAPRQVGMDEEMAEADGPEAQGGALAPPRSLMRSTSEGAKVKEERRNSAAERAAAAAAAVNAVAVATPPQPPKLSVHSAMLVGKAGDDRKAPAQPKAQEEETEEQQDTKLTPTPGTWGDSEDEEHEDYDEYEDQDDFVYIDDLGIDPAQHRGRTWTAANVKDKPISYAALWYLQGDRGRSSTLG